MLSSTKERIAQIVRLIITTTCAVPEEGIYGEKYGVPEYGCSAALHLWDFLATADIATLNADRNSRREQLKIDARNKAAASKAAKAPVDNGGYDWE